VPYESISQLPASFKNYSTEQKKYALRVLNALLRDSSLTESQAIATTHEMVQRKFKISKPGGKAAMIGDFSFFVSVNKAESSADGELRFVGQASSALVDKEGHRVTEKAIQAMRNSGPIPLVVAGSHVEGEVSVASRIGWCWPDVSVDDPSVLRINGRLKKSHPFVPAIYEDMTDEALRDTMKLSISGRLPPGAVRHSLDSKTHRAIMEIDDIELQHVLLCSANSAINQDTWVAPVGDGKAQLGWTDMIFKAADTLGRQPGGTGEGPGGVCVCPECGYETKHDTGEPCYEMKCPKCGSKLTRPTTGKAKRSEAEEVSSATYVCVECGFEEAMAEYRPDGYFCKICGGKMAPKEVDAVPTTRNTAKAEFDEIAAYYDLLGKTISEITLEELEKAKWTTAYVNDLPDSAFLYVENTGKKDEDGKTVPRSARHLPFRDKQGNYDCRHLHAAAARANQIKGVTTTISAEKKQALKEKAQRLYNKHCSTAKAADSNTEGGESLMGESLENASRRTIGEVLMAGITQLLGTASHTKLGDDAQAEKAGSDSNEAVEAVAKDAETHSSAEATGEKTDIAKLLDDLINKVSDLTNKVDALESASQVDKTNEPADDGGEEETVEKTEADKAEDTQVEPTAPEGDNVDKVDDVPTDAVQTINDNFAELFKQLSAIQAAQSEQEARIEALSGSVEVIAKADGMSAQVPQGDEPGNGGGATEDVAHILARQAESCFGRSVST